MSGRFAPSPTGRLHLGNLRTALVAWLFARRHDLPFLVRMEDLDRHQANRRRGAGQLADLASIGLDWDGDVLWQGTRFERYEAAIEQLRGRGLVYECYCTRREIAAEIEAATQAPHGPPGAYPGTCRRLSDAQRRARREAGRPPALRLRTDGEWIEFVDRIAGPTVGVVDDVVLRRNDGVPAYNLAVVVDDAEQGVTQVVRGDDLLGSTARQIHLQELLGYPRPEYAHVPLVVGRDGERLSKRHGAVSVGDLAAVGIDRYRITAWLLGTLGPAAGTSRDPSSAIGGFEIGAVPTTAVVADLVPETPPADSGP